MNLSLDLGLQHALEGVSILAEALDTLRQLVDGHLVLLEVLVVRRAVADVGLLLDVEGGSSGGVELLGDRGGAVVELLEEFGLVYLSVRRSSKRKRT